MTIAPPLLSLADIETARGVLDGVIRETPMEPCRPLQAKLGGPVWLKCEHLQRAGSFKVRGAYLRISRLTDAERARGVVAASAGNHAQGVALAARLLGAKATVFMPESAPLPKLAATRSYGAEVQLVGQTMKPTTESRMPSRANNAWRNCSRCDRSRAANTAAGRS